MEFKGERAIYMQIAEFVTEKILRDEWTADAKIPSVRDLASSLEVNPNTVMRAYDILQQQEIVYNRRGMGLFVAETAKTTIRRLRKKIFLEEELPRFFKNIELLGISMEEINTCHQNPPKSKTT